MTIYDGGSNTSPMLGNPYCGDSLPPSQISFSNHLFIHFHSDDWELELDSNWNTIQQVRIHAKYYLLRARKRNRKFGESGNLLLYFSQKPKLKLTKTKKLTDKMNQNN